MIPKIQKIFSAIQKKAPLFFATTSRKIFTVFIACTLVIPVFLPWKDIAVFASAKEEEYELVAVLVDENLYSRGDEQNKNTLTGKIFRYATDIQNTLERTQTVVLPVPNNSTSEEIFRILEKFYIEGQTRGENKFFLQGVVFIGDIPLPHVASPVGNIPLIFPYTDFRDPTFLWEWEQKRWITNPKRNTPKPEIWHGLIPGTQSELKKFFDKNHRTHQTLANGDMPTDEKVLFIDFEAEKKSLNPYLVEQYSNRSRLMGEIKNMRFNSALLQSLMENFLDSDLFETPKNINPDWYPSDEKNFWESDFITDIKTSDPFANYPDTQAKKTIEKFLPRYSQMTEHFDQQIHQLVQNTGRWEQGDSQSVPGIITLLDEYTANEIQKINTASLQNTKKVAEKLDGGVLVLNSGNIPQYDTGGEDYSIRYVNTDNYKNGKKFSAISTPEQCSLYRGSLGYFDQYQGFSDSNLFLPDPLPNIPSQLVEFSMLHDTMALQTMGSQIIQHTKNLGGCSAVNRADPSKCDPSEAITPVFSWNGGQKITNTTQIQNYDPNIPIGSALECKTFNLNPSSTHNNYNTWGLANQDTSVPYGSIVNNIKKIPSLIVHNAPSTNGEKILEKVLSSPVAQSLPSNRTHYVDLQTGLPGKRKYVRFNASDYFRYQYKSNQQSAKTKYELSHIAFLADLQHIAGNGVLNRDTQPSEYPGVFSGSKTIKYQRVVQFKDGKMLRSTAQQIPDDDGNIFPGNPAPQDAYLSDIASNGFAEKNSALDQYLPAIPTQTKNKYWSLEKIQGTENIFIETFEVLNVTGAKINTMDGQETVTYSTVDNSGYANNNGLVDNNEYNTYPYSCNDEDGYGTPLPISARDFYDNNIVVNNACTTTTRIQTNTEGSVPEQNILQQAIINQYSSEHLDFIFRWKDMLPEEKHQKAIEIFLDTKNTDLPLPNSGEKSSYAYAHLALSGSNSIQWSGAENITDIFDQYGYDSNNNDTDDQGDDTLAGNPEEKCGPIDGVELWEWIPALMCWLDDLQETGIITQKQCGIEDPNLSFIEPLQSTVAQDISVNSLSSPLLFEEENEIEISFLTEEGLIAQGEKIFFTLDISGGELSNTLIDQRSDIEGIQLSTSDGIEFISIIPHSANVTITVSAELGNTSQTHTKHFTVSKNAYLEFNGITSEEKGDVKIYTLTVDAKHDGEKFEKFTNNIYLNSADSSRAVTSSRQTTHGTEFMVAVRSEKNITITASSRGLANGSISLSGAADFASKSASAAFTDLPKNLNFNTRYETQIQVSNSLGLPIDADILQNFSITTEGIDSAVADIQVEKRGTAGEEKFFAIIDTKNIKGILRGNIALQKPGQEKISSPFSFAIQSTQSLDDFAQYNINALYASVLGLQNYGNPSTPADHLGAKLLHTSDLLNVVTTQIVAPFISQPAAIIGNTGKITILNDAVQPIITHTSPLQIGLFDNTALKYLGNFKYIPPAQSTTALRLPTKGETGLFVQNFEETGLLTIEKKSHRIEFSLAGKVIAEATTSGNVSILDNAFTVLIEKNTTGENFSLLLQKDDTPLAKIIFAGGKFTKLYQSPSLADGYEANDIIVHSATAIGTEQENKTSLFPNLHTAFSTSAFGVGFQAQEKYVLQYAAGNSVGESTISTGDIFLVNFGDPTIALPPAGVRSNGFDSTVGKEILTRKQGDIKKVFPLDFDGDGSTDIATVLSSGEILFSTKTSSSHMHNWGKGLRIDPNYRMIGTVDINKDGFDDIVYSDAKGKIFYFQNTGGVLTQEENFLPEKNIEAGLLEDFDADGATDLLSVDQYGKISLLYGSVQGGFGQKVIIDQFTFPLPEGDISDSLLLSFDGIETITGAEQFLKPLSFTSQSQNSQKLNAASLKSDASNDLYDITSQYNKANTPVVQQFASLALFSSAFTNTSKTATALADTTGRGKRIKFTTQLTSNQDKNLQVTLADPYAPILEIDRSSIVCENCGHEYLGPIFPTTANALVFENIILEPNTTLKISYEAEIVHFPRVEFSASKLNADDIKDIIIRRPDTPDLGSKKYASIIGETRKYEPYNAPAPDDISTIFDDLTDSDGNGIPDIYETDTDGDHIPDFAEEILNSSGTDTDGDGIPDSWDDNTGDSTIDSLSNSLDSIISALTQCSSGGCINMPINYAFLVPGSPNLVSPLLASSTGIGPIDDLAGNLSGGLETIIDKVGIPVGIQPSVMTVFNMGPGTFCTGPSCWVVCSTGLCPIPFPAGFSNSTFRFYLSPTLTGGMGVVVCTGPGAPYPAPPGGKCFIQAVPSLMAGLCENLQGSVSNAFQSSLSSSGGQIFRVESGYGPASGDDNSLLSISLGSIDTTIPTAKNNRSFGGPGFFTRWANRQIEEFSAMFSLPHLTVYYPDLPGSFFGNDEQESFVDAFVDRSKDSDWHTAKEDFTEHFTGQGFEEEWKQRNTENNAEQTQINAENIADQQQSLREKLTKKANSGIDSAYDKLKPAQKYLGQAQYKAKSINDFYRMLESVPLLKVQKKRIVVHIPTLSQRELHAVINDLNSWTENAQAELEGFKESANDTWQDTTGYISKEICEQQKWEDCEKNAAKYIGKKAFVKAAEEQIQAAIQLKASFEFYRDVLPKLIANLDGQVAQYIYSLICYLEAITDLAGGWLVRNKVRYEKWLEFFETVPAIMKTFQILPKIFNNYKQSCSTCTAGNYDSGNFIINIIGNILPEPPIIQFPRLPDVVLDVSQINAAITVEVPDVIFEPVRMNIPQLPPLQLPRIDSPNFPVDIPFIPTLPTFDFPTLEPFPAISVPQLPDLPPPPKLPSFFADFGDILQVIEKGLYLYCLIIRKGIFVYPEVTSMSVVETLTQRSINPLSIDLIAKRLPNFQIPSIKEIKVEVQVNLETDLDLLSQPIQNFADTINQTTTNFWEPPKQNQAIPEFLRTLHDNADSINDALQESIDDVHLDDTNLENVTDTIDDVVSSAQKNRIEQIFAPQFTALQKKWETEKDGVDVSVVRKKLGLPQWKPSKMPIIGNTYAPLKNELLALQKSHTQQAKNLHAGADIVALANQKSGIFTAEETIENNVTVGASIYGAPNDISGHDESAPLQPGDAKFLPSLQNSLPTTLNPKEGIFLQDIHGDAVQMMAYTDELPMVTSFFFLDIDTDGDDDVLYSTGFGVFIKENFSAQSTPQTRTLSGIEEPAILQFSTILPYFSAPKNLTTNGDTASLSLSVWAEGYDQVDGIAYSFTNALTDLPRHNATERKTYFQFKKSVFDTLQSQYPTEEFFIPSNNQITLNGKTWKFLPEEKIFLGKYDSQSLDIFLPYGDAYNVRAQWLLPNGQASTLSPHILINNSAATDTTPPLIIEDLNKKGYLYKPNTIAISQVEDLEQEEIFIAWDRDTNGTYETQGLSIQSDIFREPSQEQIPIQASDAAGNTADATVKVRYTAPPVDIQSINKTSDSTANITGFITPRYANAPITLLRSRFGKIKKLIATNADENGKYITDESGNYLAESFDLSPNGIVKDHDGNIIAELIASTGKLISKDSNYHVGILPGNKKFPMRQVLLSSNNTIVANALVQTKSDNTVQIQENFSLEDSKNIFAGVYARDTNTTDSLVIKNLPLSAPENAGGAIIFDTTTQTPLAMIYRYGNIRFFENANLQLQIANNTDTDPLNIQITRGSEENKKILFEVQAITTSNTIEIDFIRQQGGIVATAENFSAKQVAALDAQVQIRALTEGAENTKNLPFSDVSTDNIYYSALQELWDRNLINGYTDGTFRPEQKISRAEFVQIALGVTECLDCLAPSEKEKQRFYTPNPFPDVRTGTWYEFCISKAKKLSMVMGYKDGDFKPLDPISRAEAAAILIRQANIPLQNIPQKAIGDISSDAWYYSAMTTAVNIGLVENNYGFTFPEEKISRGQFAQMAAVLFSIRDCTTIDSDGDGVWDYIEIYNGFNELDPSENAFPNQSAVDPREQILQPIPVANVPKQDGENNDNNNTPSPEGAGDLCPFIPEDYDGINDTDGCPELGDTPVIENIILFAGDPEICGFLDYKAQLRKGDYVWAAILSDDEKFIFSKSTELIIGEEF